MQIITNHQFSIMEKESKRSTEKSSNWYRFGTSAILKWAKNILPKIKEESKGEDRTEVTETKQEKEIRIDNEKLNRLIDEFKSQTSLNVDGDKLTDAINGFQLYETALLERDGYSDGLRGVRNNNIGVIADARAAFIYEHTNSILQGREDGILKEIHSRQAEVDGLIKLYENEKEFNDEISDLYKREHRHFSLPIAWFYIIIGILMMFADFPISLGISKYFIDTPAGASEEFLDKIKQLDSVLFALGITFLSIYFKIMYDDYVNVGLLSKRKSEKIDLKGNVLTSIRFIIKLGILIFLIYFLYNIGSARNALNELPIKSRYPNLVNDMEVFNYRLLSFLGSTILLPLLSGIALSVGFGIISNINNIKKSIDNIASINKSLIEKEENIIRLNTIRSSVQKFNEDWNKGNTKLTKLSEQFKNAYLQGYKNGHRIKFGYDIYENANALYIDELNSK